MRAATASGGPGSGSTPWIFSACWMSGVATAASTACVEPLTMSAGTPAGTTIAVHSAASQPGTPASATVGMSGSMTLRFSLMVASARSLPSRMCCERRRDGADRKLDAALHQVEHRLRAAAVGHVGDVDAGLALEQFAGEMGERAGAGRGVAQRAGLGLRQRDEVLQRRRRHAASRRSARTASCRSSRPARNPSPDRTAGWR